MVLNDRIKTADQDYSCNACEWLTMYLDDNPTDTGIKFSEWRQIIKARDNNWEVKKGEPMRVYEWNDEYGITTIQEIPEISAICTRLDLWP